MLTEPLAPYLFWAKTRQPAAIDLAGSNLLHCTLDDLPGAAGVVDLRAPNDNGFAPLVQSIAARYGVAPGRVVTAMGCSGANFLVAAALVGPGDDVAIEQPTYDPLVGACRLMGARLARFDRRFEDGYDVDVARVAAAVTPRTRLIVLTSPHNPTGVPVSREALLEVGAIAARVGAAVLVDEVYLDAANGLDGARPHEAAATLDGPFISTASLTKSYGLAGLRSGWAVASIEVAERLRRTRDVVDNAGSGPADLLAAHAFTHLSRLSARARAILGPNVDAMRDFLGRHPQLEVAAPPGSSVVFPRLRGVADAAPFVARLLEDGVAVAPGRFFDAPAHFRVSLAGAPDALAAGLERLSARLPPA